MFKFDTKRARFASFFFQKEYKNPNSGVCNKQQTQNYI